MLVRAWVRGVLAIGNNASIDLPVRRSAYCIAIDLSSMLFVGLCVAYGRQQGATCNKTKFIDSGSVPNA